MIPKIFNKYLKNRRTTLLAVGPMSKNCVEATIEIANEKKVPIMMIASRRQIDSKEMGGGYVNNWDTKSFSNYVKKRDKNKYHNSNNRILILCFSQNQLTKHLNS